MRYRTKAPPTCALATIHPARDTPQPSHCSTWNIGQRRAARRGRTPARQPRNQREHHPQPSGGWRATGTPNSTHTHHRGGGGRGSGVAPPNDSPHLMLGNSKGGMGVYQSQGTPLMAPPPHPSHANHRRGEPPTHRKKNKTHPPPPASLGTPHSKSNQQPFQRNRGGVLFNCTLNQRQPHP